MSTPIPRTYGHGGSKQSPRGGHGKPTAKQLLEELQTEVGDGVDNASAAATDIAAIQLEALVAPVPTNLAECITLLTEMRQKWNASAAVVLTSTP